MTNQTDHKGYISIHRKLEDNYLWLAEPFTKGQAWIDLLLIANHKDNSFFLRGIKIDVKRGQIAWSEERLASRWKWSRGKLRNFLKLLEIEQQIIQHRSNKINIIEIINYDFYQKQDNKLNNKKTTKRQQIEQQKDINNNDNNVNNNKNDNKTIYQELAEGLKFVLEAKLNRSIRITNWNRDIRLLITEDLKPRSSPIDDVKRCIQAIADHYGKEYFPTTLSAGSFRKKFAKIGRAHV